MKGGVRKRGSVWYYYYEAGAIDGTRNKVERVGGKTKSEAQDSLRRALNALDTGFIEPAKLSVYDHLTDWIEHDIKETKKINTYHRYSSVLKNSILPQIGKIKLKDLRPLHIDSLLSSERKKGLSESTLQHIYGVLNAGLNRAVKMRVMNDNPCKYVTRPKREKFIHSTLSVAEFELLIQALDVSLYNDYIFALGLEIVLETGLRRGELAGLSWDSFNSLENTIQIKNNMIYSNGKTYMETPKSDDGFRTLYISDHLKDILLFHKSIQDKNKDHYNDLSVKNVFDNKKYDLVMTWENGAYLHPLYYTQRFKRLLKKVGIESDARFHDLRHTNATLLISQGVDFKTVQERLGHADIQTTVNIYAHVNKDMQMKAVGKINNLRGGKTVAKHENTHIE